MDRQKLFQGVYGLEDEKEEIFRCLDWFANEGKYKALGIKVPTALLLYGEPGCGKSLLLKNIIAHSGLPCFVVAPQDDDVMASMQSIIKEANKAEKAIVIFDEIDLLIGDDDRVRKFIQDQVDGIESNGKLFFIAATNYLPRLPKSLTRNGRFGDKLRIDVPGPATIALYFRDRMKAFYGDSFEEGYFQNEVFEMLEGNNFSELSSMANRLFLEYPDKFPDFNQFMRFLARRLNGSLKIGESTLRIAIHEACHALMLYRYSKYQRLLYAFGDKDEGHVRGRNVPEHEGSYEAYLSDIAVSYAGIIGEKVFLGSGNVGALDDLDKARRKSFVLVNLLGYKGLGKTLSSVDEGRQPSERWLKGNERKIRRLLAKIEKDDFRFIKENEASIKSVAEKLKKDNVMLGSEMERIFSSFNVKQDVLFIEKLVRRC